MLLGMRMKISLTIDDQILRAIDRAAARRKCNPASWRTRPASTSPSSLAAYVVPPSGTDRSSIEWRTP
jgi:hypothetical protein